jgi:regulatory protein
LKGRFNLSLKARGLQCLAQREHSRQELERKLLAFAIEKNPQHTFAKGDIEPSANVDPDPDLPASVPAVLDWLQQQGFLSDERFVESRVRVRASKFGNARIAQELSQHGVQLSDQEHEQLKHTELARAQAVWCRKFKTPPQSAVERAKHMRFLAGRGFSHEIIYRVVPEIV